MDDVYSVFLDDSIKWEHLTNFEFSVTPYKRGIYAINAQYRDTGIFEFFPDLRFWLSNESQVTYMPSPGEFLAQKKRMLFSWAEFIWVKIREEKDSFHA